MQAKRYKILHVAPSLNVGGAERLLVDLLSGLDRSRFEAVLVLFDRVPLEKEIWRNELITSGIKIIEIYEEKKSFAFPYLSGLLRSLVLFFKLSSLVRQEKPDVIHAHLFGDFYARPIGLLQGIPVVSTEHNINVNEPKVLTYMKRLTASFIAITIAVSEAVQDDMIKRYHVPCDRAVVIRNGINISRFTEGKLHSGATLVFGAVGRLDPQKGFDVLIKAMSEVIKSDTELICFIAGEGSSRLELEKLITDLSLDKYVLLPGVKADIPAFLASLDCFIMPSRWEGFGIAAVEAGAAALPVIASRIDGLAEIIENKVSGLLVKPDNADELAQVILTMMADIRNGKARELGINLRERVCKFFSIQIMVHAYEELYDRLISQHR